MSHVQNIAVYCGSKLGDHPAYAAGAERLAEALTGRGIGLVYGGGQVGLMGVLADAMLKQGGRVVGVIPSKLVDLEVVHRGLTETVEVETMHERKLEMARRSDALIAMPGGFGTLDETFDALTATQLRYHAKALGLLNVRDYYTPLLDFLDQAVTKGFLRPSDRANLIDDADPDRLVAALCEIKVSPDRDWEELK